MTTTTPRYLRENWTSALEHESLFASALSLEFLGEQLLRPDDHDLVLRLEARATNQPASKGRSSSICLRANVSSPVWR